MPTALSTRFGIDVSRVAGAVALHAPGAQLVMINRVIGLGFRPSLTEAALDDVIALYGALGVKKFLVSWCPLARPIAAMHWMAARGFRVDGELAKFYFRPTPRTRSLTSDLTVIHIDRSRAVEYGTLVARGHNDPPEFSAAHAATVGHPDWRHYLVLDGERPIGGGCLFLRDGVAWCGFASTVPEYRGRGAQAALLARRANDAANAGVELVCCEAAPDTAAYPSPSYRNMIRSGFTRAYVRPNMLYGGLSSAVPSSRLNSRDDG